MKQSIFSRSLPALLAGLALASLSVTPVGAAPAEQTVLTPEHLGGGAWLVRGGTANAGFIVGPAGVIVIDAQRTPPEAEQQIALIRQVTDKPIVAVIGTHGDPDHIGGLPAYPASTRFIAQENMRPKILVSAADADNGGPLFGPMYRALANHLPDHLVADQEKTTLAGVKVELYHRAPGHSSADLFVYYPQQRIVYAGDVVLTDKGRFPIIHKDGSSLGWIENMRAILALDAKIIVPGHGPIETRARLAARLADAEQRRDAVRAMVEAGKSWDEVNAALPDTPGTPMFPSFTRTTFDELTIGYPPAIPPWADLVRQP